MSAPADFNLFDRRHYPVVSVAEGYRDWMPSYEDTVQDAMDLALLESVRCVTWKAARRVADLGCGTGRTGAWLAARGAGVLDGVDATPEMLERARAKQLYASLAVGDARATGLEGGAYDLVTCSLVDEHLPAVAPLYAEAARLLRPGGHFVLVGIHPFFVMSAGMPTHFEHPTRGSVAVETYLHLPGEHVNAATAAGLTVRELHERLIDDEWIALKPKWERHRGWPFSFVLACER